MRSTEDNLYETEVAGPVQIPVEAVERVLSHDNLFDNVSPVSVEAKTPFESGSSSALPDSALGFRRLTSEAILRPKDDDDERDNMF